MSLRQTNGVRRGSPDSLVLFSRIIADDLRGHCEKQDHYWGQMGDRPPLNQGDPSYG